MKCEECDGNGRWHDASHGCSRHCKTCDGTGENPRVKRTERCPHGVHPDNRCKDCD
jgi:hypothetical protein